MNATRAIILAVWLALTIRGASASSDSSNLPLAAGLVQSAPLHGGVEKHETCVLPASTIDKNHMRGILYHVDSKGFVKRSTAPCAINQLNKGDQILKINGAPFTLGYWKSIAIAPDASYDLTVKHPGPGGSTEQLKFLSITMAEYEETR